jgi:hypothetical protein
MELHIRYKLLSKDGSEIAKFELLNYLVLLAVPEKGESIALKVHGKEHLAHVPVDSVMQQAGPNLWTAQVTLQLIDGL